MFGQRVAHGMLVVSIATGLQVGSMEPKIATAAFMGLEEWQFRGAVFFGDTIRVKRTIGEKTEHPKNASPGLRASTRSRSSTRTTRSSRRVSGTC